MKKILLLLPAAFLLFAFGGGDDSGRVRPPAVVNYYDSTFVVNGKNRKVPRFPADYKYIQVNNIPPRFQWYGNNGYCGETGIITAGLYYGQYVSQYDVRHLALVADYPDSAKSISQDDQISFNKPESSSNAVETTHMLRLKTDAIATKNHQDFLCWVKKNVAMGYPVMIGVLNNVIILGEDTSVTGGDSQYDHIVPVIGFASKHPLLDKNNKATYYPDDIILFSDNGIYTPCGNIQCVPAPDSCVPYYYPARLDTFIKTRREANSRGIYALQKDLCGSCFLYGVGFPGLAEDGPAKYYPVRMTSSLNYEAGCNVLVSDSFTGADTCCMYQGPAFGQGTQNLKPNPGSFDLVATVSGLTKGGKYTLLRFENEKDIPGKPAEKTDFTAAGSTHVVRRHLASSYEKVFYRVVDKGK